MSGLAQQHEPERMVDLRVGEQDAFDRDVTNRERSILRPHPPELLADVWRRIQEEPATAVHTNSR